MSKRKVILVIRDGWGYREDKRDNLIAMSKVPNTDKIMKNYPNTIVAASGEAVGLPKGYQGNSEVGHMTIGSGRVIFQSLEKINKSIHDGEFYNISELKAAAENCRRHDSTFHIIGLLQVEGVHSHMDHLMAILEMCRRENLKKVCIHAVTDGRDSPVTDSLKHIATLQNKLKELGFGAIATVSGRFYTMDRDKRWERTKKAYECIVEAKTEDVFDDCLDKVRECHNKNETDEFIVPRKARWYAGIKENDTVMFFNFRTDRPRQLTMAMVEEKFEGWERKPLKIFYLGMTQYYNPLNGHIVFKDQSLDNLLGGMISGAGLKQLRISETEKYAHVTFFFNGQVEKPYENEDRILIPSPRVETYDKKPEMSVFEIAERIVPEIETEKYGLIVTNLVNGDMVGHTGIFPAIEVAVEAVDKALGKILDAGLKHGYTIIVFADHGNAEDKTPEFRTSHTTNPVPVILVTEDHELKHKKLKSGKGLQDIAPTVLDILGIPKPKEMTGETLIQH